MAVVPAIRPVLPADVPALAEVYVAAYQAPPYDGCFDLETATAIVRELQERYPESCFAAEVAGQPVGFILCSTLAGLKSVVEEFVVAPELQGQGVGRALFAHALDWLREHGYPAVELVAHRAAPAHQFYCHHGFAESRSFRLMTRTL